MTETPRRFKEREEYSADEELAAIQPHRRNEPPPRFETDDYKRAHREHLEAGGFESDDDAEPKPIDEQSVDEH
jgi:hypothetical protein